MAEKKRPNLVLIMTDQMRGDCMGIAGHPDVKTPYLDSLADHGTLFENAYSACPTCVPARASLHTGLSQEHTGRVGYQDRVDWNYTCTMAGELAKAGYYTQCVGKMHVHPLRNYLGFHNVVLHDGYLHEYRWPPIAYAQAQQVADDYYWWLKCEKGADADPTETGLDCNGWTARPWMGEEKYHPTNWCASQSIDFLRRRDPRQPFFLMVSFVRPHPPFDAPQHYFDLYEHKELAPVWRGDWDDEAALARDGWRYNSLTGSRDPELVRQARAGYYASITHVDHQIGRLISAFVENRLMEDTVFLFCSDHGDMMGDHLQQQKARPYQGSIHVPMFLSGPEEYVGAWHTRSSRLCEIRDVMPTLLDLAGAPIPPQLDGRSLLREGHAWLHGEHALGELSTQFILTEKDKYIWYSQTGREQYFDLVNDPHETHDASADACCRARVAALRAQLIWVLAGREEGYSDGEKLIVGRPPRACLANATAAFPSEKSN